MKNKYFRALLLGMLITPTAIKYAGEQRGYLAFGGEFLIIPLFLLLALMWDQAKDMIEEIKKI